MVSEETEKELVYNQGCIEWNTLYVWLYKF